MEVNHLDVFKKNLRSEHEVVTYEKKYHNAQITVVEIDHQKSRLRSGEPELEIPYDYADQIARSFGNDNFPIAPEYCVPDLYISINRESSLVASGYIWKPVISFTSRFAGFTGRDQIAADPARSIAFGVMELGVGTFKFNVQETFSQKSWNTHIGMAGEYGNIKNREIERTNTNDARHLLSARACMQEVLRGTKGVYHITTPVHAERVDNYIKRQIDFEASTNDVQKPEDFKENCPEPEKGKMKWWYHGVIERKLRRFTPTLPKEAYGVDIWFHDGDGRLGEKDTFSSTYEKLLEVKEKLLEVEQIDLTNSKYAKNIHKAIRAIDSVRRFKPLSKLVARVVSRMIDTNKVGWKLVSKEYIY